MGAKDAKEQPQVDVQVTSDVSEKREQARAATALQCLYRQRRARQEIERRKQLLRLLSPSSSSTSIQSVCEDCRAAHAASVLSSPPLLLRLCAACASQRLALTHQTDAATLVWDAEAYDQHLRPGVSTLQRRYRALQSRRSRAFGRCAICGTRAARRVCRSCRRPSAYDSAHLPCCLSCDAVVHSARNPRLAGHSRVAVERFAHARRQAARTIQRRVCKWIRRRRERAVLDAMAKRATRALSRAVDRRRRQRQQRLEEDAARRRTKERMARWVLVAAQMTRLAARARHCVRSRAEERSNAAAGRIQRAFRRWRRVQRWRRTAVQRCARGYLGRKRVEMLRAVHAKRRQEEMERRKSASVVLQRRARGFLARREHRRLRDRRHFTRTTAAKKIQRQWRTHRQCELERTSAAVKIQSFARRRLAQRLAGRLRRAKRLERARNAREALRARCIALEHASAARIQRAVRKRLIHPASRARVRVQKVARRFLTRRAMLRTCVEVRAARKLQRAFRLSRATRRLPQQLKAGGGEQDEEDKVNRAWVELLDEASGYVYYFNILSKASSWERPPEMDACSPEVDASTSITTPPPSSSEWVEYWDENVGAAYYYNVKTGEATWAPPPELADRPAASELSDNQAEVGTPDETADYSYYDYYGYGGVPAPSKLAWGQQDSNYGAAVGAGGYYPADGDQQQRQGEDGDYQYYYYFGDGKEGEQEEAPDTTYDSNYCIYVTQLDQQQQGEEGEDQGTDGADNNEQQQDGDGRGP